MPPARGANFRDWPAAPRGRSAQLSYRPSRAQLLQWPGGI